MVVLYLQKVQKYIFLLLFFWATLHSCLFSSESDSDSYSNRDTSAWRGHVWSECCFFSPEIESTHMKYNEVSWTSCSQEHTAVLSKTNYSKPFSFCAPPLTLFLLSASSLVRCVFYNCLKSTFVHLCAIIDWIEIIFSSEGFNKESSAGTKSERAPRLFGGPNYRETFFASNRFIPALWLLWFIVYCLYLVFIWSI